MLRNYLSIHVAEDLTPLLRLGNFSWIVTRDFHKKSQFSTMVAAHQAEVRGPPVGRGPQVENRWIRVIVAGKSRRPGGRGLATCSRNEEAERIRFQKLHNYAYLPFHKLS